MKRWFILYQEEIDILLTALGGLDGDGTELPPVQKLQVERLIVYLQEGGMKADDNGK